MILAGGRVDELSVLTLFRPKAAVPFGGFYRIIDFALSNLMHSGIEKVGILSQYRSTSLVRHIGVGYSWDMLGHSRGAVVLPPFRGAKASDWYRGTADAVYQNLEFIQENSPDLVLILSGDHVYKMDYNDVIDFHLATAADLTVAFKQVPRASANRFGLGNIAGDPEEVGGPLVDYEEKPHRPRYDWASLTIYVFRTDVLIQVLEENQRTGKSFEFGRDIIPSMLGRFRVMGYRFRDYWGYTRTLDEFWETNRDLLPFRAKIDLEKWEVRTNLDNERTSSRAPSAFGPNAEVQDSIIPNGCWIEGRVVRSVLFPGVVVEAGAEVRDSILMYDTLVRAGAVVDRVITDVQVEIGPQARVGEGSPDRPNRRHPDLLSSGITLIGRNSVIPARRHIGRNCIIWPNLPGERLRIDVPSGETVE
jgi:glucose-1-phosphate adenylyltransferase